MAVTTDVDIVNVALGFLGKRRVSSLSDGNEGTVASLFYTTTLRTTLAAYPWPFALKFAALSESADTPPTNWVYAYTYPADCLRLWFLEEATRRPRDRTPFRIVVGATEKIIVTDLADAVAWYGYQNDTETEYSDEFVLALAWHLAAQMALTLTGKVQFQQQCWQNYYAALSEATARAGNEAVNDLAPQASWIEGR